MNVLPVLHEFFRHNPTRVYRKQTIIFDAGQAPQGLFYVVSGRVKVATTDNRGQEITIYTIGPNDPFPLAPFFIDEPHVTTYTAMTDVEAVWRPRHEVNVFLNRHPEALREMVSYLLQAFYNRVQDLSFHTSQERVLYRLIYLGERFGEPVEGGVEIVITQQELADSINLTRESTSIILNRLQDLGAVQLHRSMIRLRTTRANELLEITS